MTKVQITKDMLDNLEYDKMPTQNVAKVDETTTPSPTVMIVFAGSDLNAAAYHLAKSLETPFASNAVATLLVQESVRENFIGILQPKLPTYAAEVSNHAGFVSALKTIERLGANKISGQQPNSSATLVCDFIHEQLGAGAAVTGVVTLHTFRTAKEAIALCSKESLAFVNASIWQENHSCAFELVATLRCNNFFVNCYQISLEPLQKHIAAGSNFVTMEKTYHYETMPYSGIQKSIVFPIGTIFAN